MTDIYEPELGQALFGQPWQPYPAPDWLIAFLKTIDEELDLRLGNPDDDWGTSPFSNTGQKFKNGVFEVEAYQWDDERDPQPYNFKWQEIEVSWYKYLGRGTTVNIRVTPQRGAEMLEACLASLKGMGDV